MELIVLDPFGDYETKGYLQNFQGVKDLRIVGRMETAAFEQQVHSVIRTLRRLPDIHYEHIKDVHRRLFDSVYPWAGQDRAENAPHIAIAKAGYKTLFVHPVEIRRAVDFALAQARDRTYLREHAGEVFGYLAHAHPFLEGNGRTILTVYAELCRRAGFYITWETIDKGAFLETLTAELLQPGRGILDRFIAPYQRFGTLSLRESVTGLRTNFNRNP